jgi:dTDP-glucose pyrophosphorylase
MKAFLLAAGVGSRLRPITDTIPKCMVPIGTAEAVSMAGYFRDIATINTYERARPEWPARAAI